MKDYIFLSVFSSESDFLLNTNEGVTWKPSCTSVLPPSANSLNSFPAVRVACGQVSKVLHHPQVKCSNKSQEMLIQNNCSLVY